MRQPTAAVIFLLLATAAGAQPASNAPEVAGPDPRAVVGAPRAKVLSGTALDQEADRVSGLLRCPVCQGLSVADSPEGLAASMRQQVREMVAAGFDEEQILSYFEKSYGEFVRLQPPLRGVNWLVWAGPLAGLLVGGFIVARVLRAPRTSAGTAETAAAAIDGSAPPVPGRDALPDDAALVPYVRRVRELAYDWPGGIAPRASAPTSADTPAPEEGVR